MLLHQVVVGTCELWPRIKPRSTALGAWGSKPLDHQGSLIIC